jgi:hypothetical protein
MMPPSDPTPADLAAAEALLDPVRQALFDSRVPGWLTLPARQLTGLREAIAAALARRADEARREERTALCLAAPAAEREAVEATLLRVARNVVKHCVTRDGWHEGDECFQLDLRAAEAELLAMADRARREGVAAGLARAVELIRQEQDKPMLTATSDLLERIARRLILQPKSVDRLIERMQNDDLVDADGTALPPPGEGG